MNWRKESNSGADPFILVTELGQHVLPVKIKFLRKMILSGTVCPCVVLFFNIMRYCNKM